MDDSYLGGTSSPDPHSPLSPPSQAAVNRVRLALADVVGLLPVAEAAAIAIREAAGATAVGISLMDGSEYWDLVEVWPSAFSYERFPVNSRYPLTQYPAASERLLAGKGYFSGDAADEVMAEYRELWPEVSIGSIMGVPIVALGEVHGEVFLLRDAQAPAFTRDDMDLVAEMATYLGARLPALVASHKGTSIYGETVLDETYGEPSMSRLTAQLGDLLKDSEGSPDNKA